MPPTPGVKSKRSRPCSPYGRPGLGRSLACGPWASLRRSSRASSSAGAGTGAPPSCFLSGCVAGVRWWLQNSSGARIRTRNLGLFADPSAWTAATVQALLETAATQAGVDLYALRNQPERWDDQTNPLLSLPTSAEPERRSQRFTLPRTRAHAEDAALEGRPQNSSARKKADCAPSGRSNTALARSPDDIGRVVAAYMHQRIERAQATGAHLARAGAGRLPQPWPRFPWAPTHRPWNCMRWFGDRRSSPCWAVQQAGLASPAWSSPSRRGRR